jgi:hypothetical protein
MLYSCTFTDRGNTTFNLVPRGYGRASFRMSEVVQIGRVPVYIYDDCAWLPYGRSDLDMHALGYVGRVGHLAQLVRALERATPAEVQGKLARVRGAREYYTYAGVMHQIRLFLAHPFSGDGGAGGGNHSEHSHLSCTECLPVPVYSLASLLDRPLARRR